MEGGREQGEAEEESPRTALGASWKNGGKCVFFWCSERAHGTEQLQENRRPRGGVTELTTPLNPIWQHLAAPARSSVSENAFQTSECKSINN